MTKTDWTATEVREQAEHVCIVGEDCDKTKGMLTAFATRIAADESAVPVAWLCVTHDGSNSDAVVSEFARDTYKHTRTITPLFTHPPAQAAKVDAEAVREVIADMNASSINDHIINIWADKLSQAIGDKT